MKTKRPLILITNDDGIGAKGLASLVEVAKKFGDLIILSTQDSRSGMSHAITIKTPLRLDKYKEEEGVTWYLCSGTPVDCVKLAINTLLDRIPDLLLSGINHGSNASISVIYSGTMGAAIEGSFYGIPSVGFSITDYSSDADFEASKLYCTKIIDNVLTNGLPEGVSLNVNIPKGKPESIKGVKVCRQTKGVWKEEFDQRRDPTGKNYFWLTGYFNNYEPEAEDTDEFALSCNFVSIVPVQIDMTAYAIISDLKEWNYDL